MGILDAGQCGFQCTDYTPGREPVSDDIGDCAVCGTFDDLVHVGEQALCARCAKRSGLCCRYAVGNGACQIPTRFMCEEWERVCVLGLNGQPKASTGPVELLAGPSTPDGVSDPPKARPEGSHVPAQGTFAIPDPPPMKPTKVGGRYRPVARHDVASETTESDSEGKQVAWSTIDPAWVASLEATGLEVQLETSGPPVTLVGQRTGQDRVELTFREGCVLAEVMRAFPGARLVAITKASEHQVEPDLEDE